jgi:hypothetical protein
LIINNAFGIVKLPAPLVVLQLSEMLTWGQPLSAVQSGAARSLRPSKSVFTMLRRIQHPIPGIEEGPASFYGDSSKLRI